MLRVRKERCALGWRSTWSAAHVINAVVVDAAFALDEAGVADDGSLGVSVTAFGLRRRANAKRTMGLDVDAKASMHCRIGRRVGRRRRAGICSMVIVGLTSTISASIGVRRLLSWNFGSLNTLACTMRCTGEMEARRPSRSSAAPPPPMGAQAPVPPARFSCTGCASGGARALARRTRRARGTSGPRTGCRPRPTTSPRCRRRRCRPGLIGDDIGAHPLSDPVLLGG